MVPEERGGAAEIVQEVNTTLYTIRLLVYITIKRLFYNEKGNLSGLMEMKATSKIILPHHCKLLL